MTSDAGLIRQDTDYTQAIQEVLAQLHQMQQTPQLVSSPEACGPPPPWGPRGRLRADGLGQDVLLFKGLRMAHVSVL